MGRKFYKTLELEILYAELQDVLTASGGDAGTNDGKGDFVGNENDNIITDW